MVARLEPNHYGLGASTVCHHFCDTTYSRIAHPDNVGPLFVVERRAAYVFATSNLKHEKAEFYWLF
jgi:hypothetical protein